MIETPVAILTYQHEFYNPCVNVSKVGLWNEYIILLIISRSLVAMDTSLKLASGADMPLLGLGMWKLGK